MIFEPLRRIQSTLLADELLYAHAENAATAQALRKLHAFTNSYFEAGNTMAKLLIEASIREQETAVRIAELEKQNDMLRTELEKRW